MGISVGDAVHDAREGTTAGQLLRRADAAMYRHKHHGPAPEDAR
jgi:GGDEF domain-containing protein